MTRLKALRERKALSLAELAERAGVSKNTLFRLEHGSPAPYPRTIRKLAEALGVEPAELTGA